MVDDSSELTHGLSQVICGNPARALKARRQHGLISQSAVLLSSSSPSPPPPPPAGQQLLSQLQQWKLKWGKFFFFLGWIWHIFVWSSRKLSSLALFEFFFWYRYVCRIYTVKQVKLILAKYYSFDIKIWWSELSASSHRCACALLIFNHFGEILSRAGNMSILFYGE